MFSRSLYYPSLDIGKSIVVKAGPVAWDPVPKFALFLPTSSFFRFWNKVLWCRVNSKRRPLKYWNTATGVLNKSKLRKPERIPDVQITKISSLFSILVECTQQNVKVLPGFTRGKVHGTQAL
eukprot:sb/3475977/